MQPPRVIASQTITKGLCTNRSLHPVLLNLPRCEPVGELRSDASTNQPLKNSILNNECRIKVVYLFQITRSRRVICAESARFGVTLVIQPLSALNW